jgi:acylphosphatase
MSSPEIHGATEVWLVRVSGHVQGVGYRDACVRRARTLGITGWVRNRMDGSVEMMLLSSQKPLADMCQWLRHGISAARVEDLEVSVVPPPLPQFEHFDRLPTL